MKITIRFQYILIFRPAKCETKFKFERKTRINYIKHNICLYGDNPYVISFQFWLQRLGIQGNSNSAFLLEKLVSKSGDLNLAVSCVFVIVF